MSIFHITTVHSRRDIRIFRKECTSLAAGLGGVSMMVGDGLGNEVEAGVRFIDVGSSSKSRLKRIAFQPWRIYARLRKSNPALVHFHDPEFLPVGLLLAWSGVTVIYDAHEDVPRQILSKHWIPVKLRGLISSSFERFENFVAKRLAGVVAATPHIAERFKLVNANTIDINNYPLPDELAPLSARSVRKLQICYVGGISRIRGIRPLVESLALIPEVRLVLCGRFAEADFEQELASLPEWCQVDYLGQVDRNIVRKVMAESIAGVVTLFPTPNYLDSLPIKMFEYMSAELPVIASDFPLWRKIINDADAGLCADPSSPVAIAAAIRQLLDDPALVYRLGKSGRHAVLSRYNWPTEADKLTNFYRSLL